MVAYLRFEVRRLSRSRPALVFTVLLPVAVYLVFTAPDQQMSQHERGVQVAAIVMVTLAGWGAVMGALSVAASVAYDRADGWLRQLRTTPLAPSRVVAVKGAVSTLPAVPAVAALGAAAALRYDVSLPVTRWLLVIAVMWLGTAPFALLGLAIGYALSRQLTGQAITGTWFALAFLGGMLVSVDRLPGWLQPVSKAMPSYRYAELGLQAVDGTPPTATTVAVLVAWTLLFGGFAGRAYRRWSVLR